MALCRPSRQGELDLVRSMIEEGENVNAVDREGWSGTFLSSECSNCHICEGGVHLL